MNTDILVVDAGNSYLKWAVDNGRQLSHTGSVAIQDLDLQSVWGNHPVPDAIYVSSVASSQVTSTIRDYCSLTWKLDAQFIESKTQQLGVTNRYREPNQLGADRWAALIGARTQYQEPLVVIDCGTAVTADALNANGEFIGGVILPGIDLMCQSLLDRTRYINEIQSAHLSVFGRSTGECVRAGAEFAVAGGLNRILKAFMVELGEETKVLITGGQAYLVRSLLSKPVVPVPDLVLQGLARIARLSIKDAPRPIV